MMVVPGMHVRGGRTSGSRTSDRRNRLGAVGAFGCGCCRRHCGWCLSCLAQCRRARGYEGSHRAAQFRHDAATSCRRSYSAGARRPCWRTSIRACKLRQRPLAWSTLVRRRPPPSGSDAGEGGGPIIVPVHKCAPGGARHGLRAIQRSVGRAPGQHRFQGSRLGPEYTAAIANAPQLPRSLETLLPRQVTQSVRPQIPWQYVAV